MKQLLVTVLLIVVCVGTTVAGIRVASLYELPGFPVVFLMFLALSLLYALLWLLWEAAGEIVHRLDRR